MIRLLPTLFAVLVLLAAAPAAAENPPDADSTATADTQRKATFGELAGCLLVVHCAPTRRTAAAPAGWRVTSETGIAVLYGTGGAISGAMVGVIAGAVTGRMTPAVRWSGAIGAATAVPLGSFVGGSLLGGTGKLGWTYLGGAIGAGAGFVATWAMPGSAPASFALPAAAALPGAILGFELSHPDTSGPDARATRPFRVRPLVAPLGDGARFTVDVRF